MGQEVWVPFQCQIKKKEKKEASPFFGRILDHTLVYDLQPLVLHNASRGHPEFKGSFLPQERAIFGGKNNSMVLMKRG